MYFDFTNVGLRAVRIKKERKKERKTLGRGGVEQETRLEAK
jgi:hypothetical protein